MLYQQAHEKSLAARYSEHSPLFHPQKTTCKSNRSLYHLRGYVTRFWFQGLLTLSDVSCRYNTQRWQSVIVYLDGLPPSVLSRLRWFFRSCIRLSGFERHVRSLVRICNSSRLEILNTGQHSSGISASQQKQVLEIGLSQRYVNVFEICSQLLRRTISQWFNHKMWRSSARISTTSHFIIKVIFRCIAHFIKIAKGVIEF